MGARPLEGQHFSALQALAAVGWNSAEVLDALAEELARRDGARTADLQRRVLQRRRDLAGALTSGEDDVVGLLLEAEALRARLTVVQREREAYRFMVESLQSELRRLTPSGDAALYARIHATETIPDFALHALRRAFRKEYHPDCHAAAGREEAKALFLEVEAIFAEIQERRAGRAA